jgi:hypothetical protein
MKGGFSMEEHNVFVNLIFKPNVLNNNKVRPSEIRLLLPYIGEILEEAEEEEKRIIAEQEAEQNKEV